MIIALDSTLRTMANRAVLSNTTPLSVAHYTTIRYNDMTICGTPESQLQRLFSTLTATHSHTLMLEQQTNKERRTLKKHITGHK